GPAGPLQLGSRRAVRPSRRAGASSCTWACCSASRTSWRSSGWRSRRAGGRVRLPDVAAAPADARPPVIALVLGAAAVGWFLPVLGVSLLVDVAVGRATVPGEHRH